jgi:Xaa-Pro aminopeptidase
MDFKMNLQPPQKQELLDRIENLYNALNANSSDWGAAFIVDKVNQYYFTGTMQDGVFVMKQNGDYAYCVRNSFERAKSESPLDNIYKMNGYGSAAETAGTEVGTAFIESEVMPYAMLERLKKYFKIDGILPIDRLILGIRAVKSPYEIAQTEESGRQHKILLESIVPGLLKVGMSEAEFTADMYAEMVKSGYHGVSRFSMFQTECVTGQMGFGENSLYPTSFDGPGGMKGMCPAVPVIGDRNGYHTDRTQVYMFGANVPADVAEIHNKCVSLQKNLAAKLKPSAIPSDIYNAVMGELDAPWKTNFMGYGEKSKRVRFLGHGVGLYVDEFPIIANGFTVPLAENMTIALEPKKGIADIGLVGAEDTYVVTKDGGRCLTGGEKEIMVV